jgi:hypothetical protein
MSQTTPTSEIETMIQQARDQGYAAGRQHVIEQVHEQMSATLHDEDTGRPDRYRGGARYLGFVYLESLRMVVGEESPKAVRGR